MSRRVHGGLLALYLIVMNENIVMTWICGYGLGLNCINMIHEGEIVFIVHAMDK